MSAVSEKVTKKDVQKDLDALEATHEKERAAVIAKCKAERTAALDAVTKPYQAKRLKLRRLLDVINPEELVYSSPEMQDMQETTSDD